MIIQPASNPQYPNVAKIEDGSFQKYGDTLKNIGREIYQSPMNTNLKVVDQNLHLAFFQHQTLNRDKLLQHFATIVKNLSVRKHSEIPKKIRS